MSWVFGFIGPKIDAEQIARFASLHAAPMHQFKSEQIYITSGGHPATCYFSSDAGANPESPFSGWLAVGSGIRPRGEKHAFMNARDWAQQLQHAAPALNKLDGHFLTLQWTADSIKCHTDQLGLRSLYILRTAHGLAFSTRLDWLAALQAHPSIDFAVFGACWLTANQLSYDAPVKDVYRTPPGSSVEISAADFSAKHTLWEPQKLHEGHATFDQQARALTRIQVPDGFGLSLGLSGGMDSRAILAMLSGDSAPDFSSHVFGPATDGDVAISHLIASAEQLKHKQFNQPLPSADECIKLAREYAGSRGVGEPSSAILNLRYYSQLAAANKTLIDGGFGEIVRRQFMNRVFYKGRRALETQDSASLLPLLRVARAKVFSPEVEARMYAGTIAQIDGLLAGMPALNDLGIENYLDLWSLRTRLPNYDGPEQSRMDGVLPSFMPFAQPSLLNRLFMLPPRQRRNSRLMKRLIRNNNPRLTRFPLIKNNSSYPFYFPTLAAWFWTRLKARLAGPSGRTQQAQYLHLLKDYVNDTVLSREVRENPIYDIAALQHLLQQFYAGEEHLAPQLDWWLAFEFWRQSVSASRL